MEDSMTYPHDGATSTNTMPIQVIVPYDAKFGQQPTVVMKEAVSYIGELSNNNALSGNQTYNIQNLPFVTLNDTYQSIITQNHLSHQHNIFLPHEINREDKMQILHAQIQRLQQQLEETERKKNEEELLEWKEKHHEKQSKKRGMLS